MSHKPLTVRVNTLIDDQHGERLFQFAWIESKRTRAARKSDASVAVDRDAKLRLHAGQRHRHAFLAGESSLSATQHALVLALGTRHYAEDRFGDAATRRAVAVAPSAKCGNSLRPSKAWQV